MLTAQSDQTLPIATRHAFQFLDQRLDIHFLESALPESLGGLPCLGVNVVFIEIAGIHWNRSVFTLRMNQRRLFVSLRVPKAILVRLKIGSTLAQ